MAELILPYDQLPNEVKHNLTEEQWAEAQRDVVEEGVRVPETTVYMELKNGQCRTYQAGEVANGPLLPTHDLSGGHGKDDSQFFTTPPGARSTP